MDELALQYYDKINAQQQANNQWSAEQAQKAMDYQTEMSNTAHQREVADLKAAGLNPVLSAGGQGATTGTGHAANAGDQNVTALYGLLGKVFDAQIEQAKAMENSAKAASGNAGYSNPVDDESSPLDSIWNLAEDYAYRKYGIRKDTMEGIRKQFGDNPMNYPMIPDSRNKMRLKDQEEKESKKKKAEQEKNSTARPSSVPAKSKSTANKGLSPNQRKATAAALGMVAAALIGKGIAGGSAKRETQRYLAAAYEY